MDLETLVKEFDDVTKLSPEETALFKDISSRIEKAAARLNSLRGVPGAPASLRNQRYVIDLVIPFAEEVNATSDVEKLSYAATILIKPKTKFFCTSLESSVYAVGSLEDQKVVQAVRPAIRNDVFDFEWAIRDTGSDRRWQNTFLPSALLKTNRVNALELAVPTPISGGSDVILDINITRMRNFAPFAVNPIESFLLQVCICGFEVVAK